MIIHLPIWLLWMGGVVGFLLFVGILAYAYVGYKVVNAFNKKVTIYEKIRIIVNYKTSDTFIALFCCSYLLTSPCLGHENLIRMHNVADLLMTVQNS